MTKKAVSKWGIPKVMEFVECKLKMQFVYLDIDLEGFC